MTILKTILAFSAVVLASSSHAEGPLPNKAHVYVEGSAQFDVAPDSLTISVQIASVSDQIAVAKADVDTRSQGLIEASRSLGITPDRISSTTLSVSPSYDWTDSNRRFVGTEVARQIEIVLNDLSKYSELVQAIVSANVGEITSTTLHAASSPEVEDKALRAALADATERARGLAQASGRELGQVYSISEFRLRNDVWNLESARLTTSGPGGSRPDIDFVRVSSLGTESFTPGLLTSRATVFVVFELNK